MKREKGMNELLARIIEAHGTIDRWKSFERVEITIVSGGGLINLKGRSQDSTPRRMTVWLHEERTSISPYGWTFSMGMRMGQSSCILTGLMQPPYLVYN